MQWLCRRTKSILLTYNSLAFSFVVIPLRKVLCNVCDDIKNKSNFFFPCCFHSRVERYIGKLSIYTLENTTNESFELLVKNHAGQ